MCGCVGNHGETDAESSLQKGHRFELRFLDGFSVSNKKKSISLCNSWLTASSRQILETNMEGV